MKKLKVKVFGGFHKDEELVNFINENNILKEDILKIAYRSNGGNYALFYYSDKEEK
jgi:hypothetical protein